jgi:type II secretory pathway pseudopilin PulG
MENKTGKYFKYAIGEIVLVVIGILIALQINNWNENRKEQNQLQTYYKQIISDFDEQKEYSRRVITSLDSSISSYNKYKNILETKSLTINIIIDELNKVEVTSPYLSFRFNTMETLQSTGDIKIIPEDLRNKLITHKSKLDSWTIVNNGNLEIYLNGLMKYSEKGIGGLTASLREQAEIKKAIRNEIKPIEAILTAESAFGVKFYTEKKTREFLKEVLKEIETMEYIVNSEMINKK